jgi:hypothetical protein
MSMASPARDARLRRTLEQLRSFREELEQRSTEDRERRRAEDRIREERHDARATIIRPVRTTERRRRRSDFELRAERATDQSRWQTRTPIPRRQKPR